MARFSSFLLGLWLGVGMSFSAVVVAEDCEFSSMPSVPDRVGLSDRAYAACCKPEEAAVCVPALKKRLVAILNPESDGRKVYDLKYVLPTILRVGGAGDLADLKKLYMENAGHPIISSLFAEAFLERRLLKAAKDPANSLNAVFPAQDLATIGIPVDLAEQSLDLLNAYRMYMLMKGSLDKLKACSAEDLQRSAHGDTQGFWERLSRYLIDETPLDDNFVSEVKWLCPCAQGADVAAQIILGVRLLKLAESGERSEFIRAYALGWRQKDFHWRRVCAYAEEDLFNAGIDDLMQRSKFEGGLIYLGAMLAGDASLEYEALCRNKAVMERAAKLLPLIREGELKTRLAGLCAERP